MTNNVTPTRIVPEQYNTWNNSTNNSQASEDGFINIRNTLSSKWWNNKASDIKLVFLYSTIKTMHGPINIIFTNNQFHRMSKKIYNKISLQTERYHHFTAALRTSLGHKLTSVTLSGEYLSIFKPAHSVKFPHIRKRLVIYVQRNIETRSCNRCFCRRSNSYCIFSVCVSSLRYPACNSHVPCCHMWPVWLYTIIYFALFHKRHDFPKKKGGGVIQFKEHVLIFSTNFNRFSL